MKMSSSTWLTWFRGGEQLGDIPVPQILDACVLINLLASDEIEAILAVSGRQTFICSVVQRESIYLRTEDPKAPRIQVDLQPLIDSKLLTLCSAETDEEVEIYVDYASLLDDGEALSLAIALSRGYLLATDERKARRLFLEAAGDPMHLTSTSSLVRMWAQNQSSPELLKECLLKIERRARYQPPTTDENYQWWLDSSK
jgi:predicted nucleic acid-binding protein